MDEILKLSMANAGIKHDSGKPDLSIVPLALEEACARAFTFGAGKYGRNNYKNGLQYTRLLAAAFRHLKAWNEISTGDPESGLSHLDHAIASLAMLAVSEAEPFLKEKYDDRDLHENSQISKSRGSNGLAARLLSGERFASSARSGNDGTE